MVNLLVFLLIVYPFCMFLLTDLSPQNRKLFAVVYFPNCFTVLNIYRPIGALVAATNNAPFAILPAVFLFVGLLALILKYPMITWRSNKLSQAYFSCILWIILCRFMELGARTNLLIEVKLVGTPIFVLFMAWILKKRTLYILNGEKNSVLKLKMLYLALFY